MSESCGKCFLWCITEKNNLKIGIITKTDCYRPVSIINLCHVSERILLISKPWCTTFKTARKPPVELVVNVPPRDNPHGAACIPAAHPREEKHYRNSSVYYEQSRNSRPLAWPADGWRITRLILWCPGTLNEPPKCVGGHFRSTEPEVKENKTQRINTARSVAINTTRMFSLPACFRVQTLQLLPDQK